MKNFLADVCLVSARKRKTWQDMAGHDKNDINWSTAILTIEAWEEEALVPGKEAQHAVRLTKCR